MELQWLAKPGESPSGYSGLHNGGFPVSVAWVQPGDTLIIGAVPVFLRHQAGGTLFYSQGGGDFTLQARDGLFVETKTWLTCYKPVRALLVPIRPGTPRESGKRIEWIQPVPDRRFVGFRESWDIPGGWEEFSQHSEMILNDAVWENAWPARQTVIVIGGEGRGWLCSGGNSAIVDEDSVAIFKGSLAPTPISFTTIVSPFRVDIVTIGEKLPTDAF